MDKPQNSTPEPLGSINLQPGDRVEIIEGRFYGSRATVQEVTNDEVTVRAARWVVNRSYRPDQLRFISRGESS
ncbi:MAG: KOW motif-containing protein [Elainella sp. C42_A2020_010]|nr:KOW motif-containing protein [Elainella sp. C42_A2020_010]